MKTRTTSTLWYVIHGTPTQNPSKAQLEAATHYCREGDKTWTEIQSKPAAEPAKPIASKPLFAT